MAPIEPLWAEVWAAVEAANRSVNEHNARVANLPNERKKLTSQVWRYLLDIELKTDLDKFIQRRSAINSAINALTTKITAAKEERVTLDRKLRNLERQTTSIRPTMDAINLLLASFGFTTFRLAESSTAGMYELRRSNGAATHSSLSEGERTFLTFLYFYHLIGGSESDTGTATRRVVVFDDPISSLDSDILFVVSNLVKNVCELAKEGTSHVAQVFVLTHNIYFHKEVTFSQDRANGKRFSHESFWVVRRVKDHTEVACHETNPVKSSYEALWAEVRSENPSPTFICNAMRRILEHYFKLLGRRDLHTLSREFAGEEQLICRSLVSWMHDGSHFSMEDLHLSPTDDAVAKYRVVFQKVFEKLGHEAHYRMMMGST